MALRFTAWLFHYHLLRNRTPLQTERHALYRKLTILAPHRGCRAGDPALQRKLTTREGLCFMFLPLTCSCDRIIPKRKPWTTVKSFLLHDSLRGFCR
jgi:hypothetical protein